MQLNSMNGLSSIAILLLAACGGSGSNAALTKTFNYGAPQAPSASEQSAASSAQSGLSDTAGFSASPDAAKGAAIVVFADTLAALALGSASPSLPHPTGPELAQSIRNADFSACTTVSPGKVTFKDCAQKEAGFSLTLNGSISASAGAVTWDIAGGFSGTTDGITANMNIHQAGSMAVTATKISGSATSDFGGTVSGQGRSVSFGLATAALVDLTYQTTPGYCVTAGTVEVKRVWTQTPNGATGPQFADAGVKLTWSACNSVTVQRSR